MKSRVTVSFTLNVRVDKKKFNEAFMKEFRESFYKFFTIEDHMKHLAQLYVRGLADNGSFIEGYGNAADMGIEFEMIAQEEDME